MVTGWEFERRVHFDEIVVNYDKARPEYPSKLFADIFNYASGKKALEIGAGTGKATKPFLDAGYDVTAVEMGANMADFLRAKFKNLNVIVSTFEEAELDDTYDLIYAANAIHWVDAEIGLPKIFRLLKNGGVCALFRYNGVPDDGEELYEEIQAIYEKHYRTYYQESERPYKDVYGNPEQILYRFGCKELSDYGFSDISMKLYDAVIPYTAEEYIELLETLADHRSLPDENKKLLYTNIKEAIIRHGGILNAGHTYQLYMGRKII